MSPQENNNHPVDTCNMENPTREQLEADRDFWANEAEELRQAAIVREAAWREMLRQEREMTDECARNNSILLQQQMNEVVELRRQLNRQ